MNVLLAILLFVFVGVALMVVLGERFARPVAPERMHRFSRWLMILVGLMIVVSLLRFYLQ